MRVVRMNVPRNEKSLDSDYGHYKMTITALFKAKINFGKIGTPPTKTLKPILNIIIIRSYNSIIRVSFECSKSVTVYKYFYAIKRFTI